METFLLYFGIGLTVIGWLALSWFAAKQMKAQKEYERIPLKWEEVKRGLVRKRWICRVVILIGIIVILISLLINK
ncbi:MAG: hypothetical protein NC411_04765 [Bacteroides sp.]|nr:hypothetical protein [Bacteroides sp.]